MRMGLDDRDVPPVTGHKASRAEIGTWTTKWLKLPIYREFERKSRSQFLLSDKSFLLTVEEKISSF